MCYTCIIEYETLYSDNFFVGFYSFLYILIIKGMLLMDINKTNETKTYKILEIDPYLKPFESDLNLRMDIYNKTLKSLLGGNESLVDFANGYMYYGFHKTDDGWYYREWAPKADALYLIGDFNNWDRSSHPLTKDKYGNWEIFIKGTDSIKHGQKVKVQVTANGRTMDRIPAYIRRLKRNEETNSFDGQIWYPDKPFEWTDNGFKAAKISNPALIYECHVGMAQEKEGLGTYIEFADNILPRIKEAGYNIIQLMGIMEHPYYASFGYQVSSFYAASAWFGTPDDLKYLINKAHNMGISVLLDLVHSHSTKNLAEGLNMFDGSDDQYFHPGPMGDHPAWDSKLFQYGRHEVLHFLLSNVKFWMDEYHFDGFRFDGVTSMLYHDHGLGQAFDSYDKYFSMNTDTEAVCYLQLANTLIKEYNKYSVTIAEDMSGMPGMCLPVSYGGIGFDYRLSMGVPDFWIKTLKECRDEDWDIFKMWHELTTRRPKEKNIGYAESHDQALVGDKTIIFWLADKEMYYCMEKTTHTPIIDRAIALHKMIRLITMSLAGEGYLCFMGNEFGHPEWIDFPRLGNNWSYKYARRQWSLVDNGLLKYQWLADFDKAMLKTAKSGQVFDSSPENLWMDKENKIIAYRKGKLIFLFNFHPEHSNTEFFVPTHAAGKYKVVLSTDDPQFGGQGRVDSKYIYECKSIDQRGLGFKIYIPARTAIVLKDI